MRGPSIYRSSEPFSNSFKMLNLKCEVSDTSLDCGRKVESSEGNPCENGKSVQTPHRNGQHTNYVQLEIDLYGRFP